MLPQSGSALARRELATRNARWAGALARQLASIGVKPNAVSVGGVVFAAIAGGAFALVPRVQGSGTAAALLFVAAAGIQLRLLCNMLDGMLAVEHRLGSKLGDLYNELPDRLADVIILVGAGYALPRDGHGIVLGWSAAVCAVFTAYVRVLAGSLGVRQHFIGPMAKQHRMFMLTVAALLAISQVLRGRPPHALEVGLIVIVGGAIVTAIRRVARLAAELSGR
jgi:phosphatidylglycerophosphate synthase